MNNADPLKTNAADVAFEWMIAAGIEPAVKASNDDCSTRCNTFFDVAVAVAVAVAAVALFAKHLISIALKSKIKYKLTWF